MRMPKKVITGYSGPMSIHITFHLCGVWEITPIIHTAQDAKAVWQQLPKLLHVLFEKPSRCNKALIILPDLTSLGVDLSSGEIITDLQMAMVECVEFLDVVGVHVLFAIQNQQPFADFIASWAQPNLPVLGIMAEGGIIPDLNWREKAFERLGVEFEEPAPAEPAPANAP